MKVIVFLLAMGLLTFGAAIVTMKALTWGRTVVVPDESGKELASAIIELKGYGLEIKVDRQEHHPSVPSGFVIEQSPLPGSTVKKGRSVSVVVSLGSEEVGVPILTGDIQRRAQPLLKQAGLTMGDTVRAYSDAPIDSVIAQYPAAQAVVQKGVQVDLLISGGPVLAKYITPDLRGRTLPEAEAKLRPMGITVSAPATAQAGAGGAGREVVSQEPKAGYAIMSGDVIKVALGAAPQTQPSAQPAGAKPQAAAPFISTVGIKPPAPAQAAPASAPAPARIAPTQAVAPSPAQPAPAQKPKPSAHVITNPLAPANTKP